VIKLIIKFVVLILSLVGLVTLLISIMVSSQLNSSPKPHMNEQALTYQEAKKIANQKLGNLSEEESQQAVTRFVDFLSNVGSTDYIEREIDAVYAQETYLNDTLKTFHTRAAIKEHFMKTAKAMTTYSLDTTDVTKSEKGYYVSWVMTYSSPKFAKGKDIVSIGVSYVMFDDQGLVTLHQDYWDSNAGFFEHLPVVSHLVKWIKNRL